VITGGSTGRARHVECVAFVATASGLGRTAVVANTALILAGVRARVLIVDWSGEEPAARSYFRRFGVGPSDGLSAVGRLFDELTEGRPGVWQAARYQPPGGIAPIDLATPTRPPSDGRIPALPWHEPIQDIVARLRAGIDESDYDYVLVDVPTDPDDDIIDVVARGADQAVVLFEPSRPSVAGAAAMAEKLMSAAVAGVTVLPLEVQLRQDDPESRRVSDDLVAEWFSAFLLDGDDPILTVPFVPAHMDRQVLATLADEPGSDPARAYSALAAELTSGEVSRPPVVPADLRGNYRVALGIDEPQEAGYFTIVHTWPYRRYADWVRAQLEVGGGRVVLAGPTEQITGRAIWIVSPELLAVLPGTLPNHDRDLALLVPGVDGDAVPSKLPAIALDDGRQGQVRLRLLGQLGLVSGVLPRAGAPAFVPRFPPDGRPTPLVTNFTASARIPFTGREEKLTRLRDRLTLDTDGCEPQVVSGPPGIGKTATVLEYLRLFGDDYDVIWWISARTPDLARLGLSELADELGIHPQGDKAASAVAELRAHRAGWLLVYDDAGDLAELDGLIPVGGPGHVLVTSRTAGEATADEGGVAYAGQRLEPVGTAEGAALLREQVNGLTSEHADAVAEMLQGLPLALQLAAAWLSETADWLAARRLTTDESAAWAAAEYQARIERHVADGRTVPAACLAVLFQTLEEAGSDRPLDGLAVRLLELCAWLAPEGVGHRLLASASFLDRLVETAGPEDGAPLAADSMVLDQVLRICVQFGLAHIVWKRAPIFRVHRMVQELIRDRLVEAGLAEARQAAVLQALARTVPPAVEGPITRHADRFLELRRHLEPSGAMHSPDPWVRRWIVDQVRFQYVSGDQAGQRQLLATAERLLDQWPDDLPKGRLLGQAANICRVLGEFETAYRYGERALSILTPLATAGEYWALAEQRGRCADLRGLGRFVESLGEIQGVYERTRLLFGADHRETGMTMVNLAESAFLMGQYPLALVTATTVLAQREAEFGELDWVALQIARRVGDYRGAVGDWPGAWRLLDLSHRSMRDMPSPNELAELELLRSLGIASRYNHTRGSDLSYKQINHALRGLRGLLGRDHPSTLATELSLGTALAVAGDHRTAITVAGRCSDGFASVYGTDHPVVQLCHVDLGAFLLAGGQDGKAALRTVQDAVEVLSATLGEQHPWTMAAMLHRAGALITLGRFEEAQEKAEQTAVDALELLGPVHPYTAAITDTFQAAREKRPLEARDPRTTVYLDVPFI
jgi:tetratricopeptide (TPR) repeat protein/cellulose biosynthesis protein BcsQ